MNLNLMKDSIPFLLQGMLVTLKILGVSICIGLVGGGIVGVLGSRRIQWGRPFFRFFVWLIQGTPLFLQVLCFYYAIPELIGVSLSPFWAGVLALGINSTAYVSETIRGAIDGIPSGQWEAARALGSSRWITVQHVILPQALRLAYPGIVNEMTNLLKDTSILMVIGVAEVTKASKDIATRSLDPVSIFALTLLSYLMLTTLVRGLMKVLFENKKLLEVNHA